MSIHMKRLTLLVITGLLAQVCYAQGESCTVHGRVKLINQNDVLISSPEAGILKELPFREGAVINEGEVIAKLDDRDAQLRMEAAEKEFQKAKVEADSTADIEAAEAARLVAEEEWKENLTLNRLAAAAVTENEIRRSELTATRAGLQKTVAEHEHLVAIYTAESTKAQSAIAKNDFEKRSIESPIGGQIEEILGKRGQWLQQGEPILRLVNMSTLKIEGFLDADKYSQAQVIGQPVSVKVTLANGQAEQFTGEVKFVSQLIDAKGDYRMWAEVENKQQFGQWLLHPGRLAEMTIAIRPPGQFANIPNQRKPDVTEQPLIVRKPPIDDAVVDPTAAEKTNDPAATPKTADPLQADEDLKNLITELDKRDDTLESKTGPRRGPRQAVSPRDRFRP